MAETLESLKANLARLLEVMTEARESGNEALANLLAEHAAKYVAQINDMQDPAEQSVAQQQQQVQPAKGQPED